MVSVVSSVVALALLVPSPASAATNPTVTVPVETSPVSVSVSGDGTTAFVANRGSNTLSRIDVASNTVTGSFDPAATPASQSHTPLSVLAGSDGQTVYTALTIGNSKLVVPSTYETIASIPTPLPDLGRMALSSDGSTLFAPNPNFGNILLVDAAAFTITGSVPTADAFGVAVTPDQSKLLVIGGPFDDLSILAIDGTLLATVPVPAAAEDVAVSPDGSTAYVTSSSGELLVVDVATGTVTASVPLGSASHVVASPNGRWVYVTNPGAATLTAIDAVTRQVTATYAVGAGASGLAVSPDGFSGFVTNTTDNTVSIVDLRIPPTIDPTQLGELTIGQPFTFPIAATGFPAPTFSVTSGQLPAGLTLDPVTGVIAGSPTTAGAYSFTVTATNPVGTASTVYAGTIPGTETGGGTDGGTAPTLAASGYDSGQGILLGSLLAILGSIIVAVETAQRRRPHTR